MSTYKEQDAENLLAHLREGIDPDSVSALRAAFPRQRGKALDFSIFTFYSTIFSANVVY